MFCNIEDIPLPPSIPALIKPLSQPTPNFSENNVSLPLAQTDVTSETSQPYYKLPAALMVPLIKLEDNNYKPLDPDKIKLPPPTQLTERLQKAVNAFYMPLQHFSQIDDLGWETHGLDKYYYAKNYAIKQKEHDITYNIREKSKSPVVIRVLEQKSSLRKKRYRSRSRSPTRQTPNKNSNSPPTPNCNHQVYYSYKTSPPTSPPPPQISQLYSPPPSQISQCYSTPHSFGSGFGKTAQECFDLSNKGRQPQNEIDLGCAGLGFKIQDIDIPIVGGDIRDIDNQYNSVGTSLNDPYENFRKYKGKKFLHRTRMYARNEEQMEDSRLS